MSSPPSSFDPDHFPVRLNHSLNDGQHTILRKLGEGLSSSSWLVHNNKGKPNSDKYQALKILTIDATQRHDSGQSRELKFLQEIEERKIDDDFDFLPLLRDHFVEQGPRGKHLCLVQDLYSTSVSSLRLSSPTKTLPPYIVRNIISMVVDALAKLHSMRIVHTDIKPNNLLLCNSLYYLDDDLQKYLKANPAEFEGQAQLDGETYPIFKSQPIPNRFTWDTRAFEAETMLICVTDLGSETILQSDFGSGVDIWAVGCMTFELLIGRWLFDPEGEDGWNIEDDHLAKMMELAGEAFPVSMLERANRRKEFFDDAGNLLRIPELITFSLKDAMKNYKIPNLSEDEIKAAAEFIRACLKLDYVDRATAKDLQKHRFLADAFTC